MRLLYILIFTKLFAAEIVSFDCPQDYVKIEEFCGIFKNFHMDICPFENEQASPWVYMRSASLSSSYFYIIKSSVENNGMVKSKEFCLYYDYLYGNRYIQITNAKPDEPMGCRVSGTLECQNFIPSEWTCIYQTELNICQAIDKICGDLIGIGCYCFSAFAKDFFCSSDTYCQNPSVTEEECRKCDELFTNYPTPNLTLSTRGSKLFLKISNYKKLKYLTKNEPVTCYGDSLPTIVIIDDYALEKDKYPFKFKLTKRTEDEEFYEITQLIPFTTGTYWCTGFTYPNFFRTNSNSVRFISKNYDFTLITKFKQLHSSKLAFVNVPSVITDDINALAQFNGFANHVKRETEDFPLVQINGYFDENVRNLEEAVDYFKDRISTLIVDGETIKSPTYCPEDTVNLNQTHKLTWGKAAIGESLPSKEMCYNANRSLITRTCLLKDYAATWGEINGKCVHVFTSTGTQELQDMLNGNFTAQEIIEKTADILDGHLKIQSYDIYLLAQIIEKIAAAPEDYSLNSMIGCISKIMDLNSETLKDSQNAFNATDHLLRNIDFALTQYSNHIQKDNEVIFSDNLDLIMVKVKPKEKPKSVALLFTGDKNIEMIKNAEVHTLFWDYSFDFAVVFQGGLLDQILNDLTPNFDKKGTRSASTTTIVTSLFKKDTLFNSGSNIKLTGFIPSIFATNFQTDFLYFPLQVLIRPFRNYRYDRYCSFWKYGRGDDLEIIPGFWKRDHKASKRNGLLFCEFKHMTHFGIMLDLPSDDNLKIITLSGSVFSLFAIGMIFVTAAVSPKWRESESAKITMSSCAATVVQIIFLYVAGTVDSYDSPNSCVAVGVILHYAILAQFSWMLVLGVLQYRKFVVVFTHSKYNVFLISSLIAWLLPFLPITLTLVLFLDNYLKDQYCYLTGDGLLYGVIIPISATILANIIIFSIIFFELAKRKARQSFHKEKDYGLYVKLCIFLFFLLGFSWIFGLLNGFFRDIVLSYLFSIFASCQGVVLFWYHVVLNQDAVYSWKKFFKHKLGIAIEISSSTARNGSTNYSSRRRNKSKSDHSRF